MTKDFNSIKEAFDWFMENVYPNLSPEQKQKLKDVKYDYNNPKRGGVSEKRMQRVLTNHNHSLEFIVRMHIEAND